jgi:hypothetical protein
MRKFILAFCLFFSATAMLVAQGWRDGEMEISVKISSQETAMKIAKLGLPGDYSNGAVVLYVTPAEMQKVAMITDDITILKNECLG